MKLTPFAQFVEKYRKENDDTCFNKHEMLLGWNAALEKTIGKIKYRHREFKGNWQHEDIEILMEELKELMEK